MRNSHADARHGRSRRVHVGAHAAQVHAAVVAALWQAQGWWQLEALAQGHAGGAGVPGHPVLHGTGVGLHFGDGEMEA